MRLRGDRSQRDYDVQPAPRLLGGQAEVRLAYDAAGQAYAVKAGRTDLPGFEDDAWLDQEADLVDLLLARYPDLRDHVVPVVDRATFEGRRRILPPAS